MIETTLRDTTGGDCWSGRVHPELKKAVEPPVIYPCVLSHNHHASVVLAGGTLTQRSLVNLAGLVLEEARRPEIRMVYLLLAIQAGRIGSLRTAGELLVEAGRHAATIAFLESYAWGPSLWLAGHCGLVFASPATSIGWIECVTSQGELEGEASMAMVQDLAALNPNVAPSTWARLLQAAVTGEQAEAMGIVGGMRRDVWSLSGIDGNGWGPDR